MQSRELFRETKAFEDLADLGGKAGDVTRDLAGYTQFAECQAARMPRNVQPAKQSERQNDVAVFGLFVIAAQQIGDAPDEADSFLEAVHLRTCSTGRRSFAQAASAAPDAIIGIVATRTLMTVEQFERLPEQAGVRYELDHGELLEVSGPNYQHNRVRDKVITALNNFIDAAKIGEAVAEQEFRIAQDTVRRPDVAFLRSGVAARIDKSKSVVDCVPDLVIEIVSPNDTAEQLMHRVNQFLAAGCQCVWIVYPAEKKVHAYGPNDDVRIFNESKTLEAPALLPGFALPVSRIFEE